ncbi:MAG: type VI secretion system domain-containing protein, partial [Gemmatimonadales bacterium]
SGLTLLQGLLERFWDNLYPELDDGDASLRVAPLEWIGLSLRTAVQSVPLNKGGHDFFRYQESRLVGYEAAAAGDEKKQAARQAAIGEGKLAPEDFDKGLEATPKAWYKQFVAELAACTDALQALDAASQQKFGAGAPTFDKLRETLHDVGDVARDLLARKLAADPDPPDAVPAEPGESRAGSGAGASRNAMPAEPADPDDAAGWIGAAARFLRRADPRSPAPYLLLRGFRWGEVRARGRELDPKLLSAPPTAVRTQLKALLLDSRWPELLEACETVMATPHGRGWLDLQRYALTACQRLGSEYGFVTAAIRGALAALLRDLPQLPGLTLMDDTPTANAETQAWLEASGIVAAAGGAPEGSGQRPSVEVHAPAPTSYPALERALAEVRLGRPQKGIELLMRAADQEKSERARFLCRSEAAGIMVGAGLEPVAMPILKELLEQIDAHRLEDWEAGDLVARPLGLMYRCLNKLGGDAGGKDELYRRICRLDPLLAMGFPGAGGGTDGATAR